MYLRKRVPNKKLIRIKGKKKVNIDVYVVISESVFLVIEPEIK